jgi:hypothetical protein
MRSTPPARKLGSMKGKAYGVKWLAAVRAPSRVRFLMLALRLFRQLFDRFRVSSERDRHQLPAPREE